MVDIETEGTKGGSKTNLRGGEGLPERLHWETIKYMHEVELCVCNL